MHTGSAECGHYYSFINTSGKQLEFNDSTISTFDPVNIPNYYAFGG